MGCVRECGVVEEHRVGYRSQACFQNTNERVLKMWRGNVNTSVKNCKGDLGKYSLNFENTAKKNNARLFRWQGRGEKEIRCPIF